jgi:HKD family nuclease
MNVDFVVQPQAIFRVGDFLTKSFGERKWTEFRAAIAFVKRSGTKHIRVPLKEFSERGGVARISAGIDAGGTSAEGLTDLLEALDDRGSVFVFKNANSSTFHPKIYLFRNTDAAEIIVGSSNLTEGGLFTNYEAGFLIRLNLAEPEHAALLSSVTAALDAWSTPSDGLCYVLTPEVLRKLIAAGLVPNEKNAWGDEQQVSQMATADGATALFTHHPVPAAPKVPLANASGEEESEEDEEHEDDEGLVVVTPPPVPGQGGNNTIFLMTLQNTDVGVGQTTKGTQRRSPEIFIPLISRDFDPQFWGWPNLFHSDPNWTGKIDSNGRGKMDRAGVMVRLGGDTFPIHMWYNPDKKDLRLRSEHMRSAGIIGDILYVERTNGSGGFAYYVEVIPQGTTQHAGYLSQCNRIVRNSQKRWAYI